MYQLTKLAILFAILLVIEVKTIVAEDQTDINDENIDYKNDSNEMLDYSDEKSSQSEDQSSNTSNVEEKDIKRTANTTKIYTGTIKGTVKLSLKNDLNNCQQDKIKKIINRKKDDKTNVSDGVTTKELMEKEILKALREIIKEYPLFKDKNEFRKKSDVYKEELDRSDDNIKTNEKIFPYTACVHKKGSHFTNGALLDNQWVVTAASEFYNVRESIKVFNIRLGSSNCKNGLNVPLKMVEIHPSYRVGSPNFDVAVLKLAHPVEFNNHIQPIEISQKKELSLFSIIYWAKGFSERPLKLTSKPNRPKRGDIKSCKIESLSQDKCHNYLRKSHIKIVDSSRCMKSGGDYCERWEPSISNPVIALDGLYGITSPWQNTNLTRAKPVIFTVITNPIVKNWIQHVMSNN